MLALLSPAKKLDFTPAVVPFTSQPQLMQHTDELMRTTRGLSVAAVKKLMHLSDNLAELNVERFQSFSTPFTSDNAHPAVTTFAGDVYLGLDARTLSQDDLTWAQEHIAILSGLYGVLRPLDLMQAYRLEMGTSLQTARGKNLYRFWGDILTRQVERLSADHSDSTVINLASKEYATAVALKKLERRVVTPVFKDIKDGEARVLGVFAKHARGSMARFMVTNRCTQPTDLLAFDGDGYRFDEDKSEGDTWVFTRIQPPPKR